MFRLSIKDLSLIAQIFSNSSCHLCIFDPINCLEDKSNNELIIRDIKELRSLINSVEKTQHILLVNLSNEELLDLYCNPAVEAVLRFHHKSVSSFNPFATFHYLLDEQGALKTILSPGATKIRPFIKSSETFAGRIKTGVKNQGIKLGLQRYIADGSFTFYYKQAHPVEQFIESRNYDGYTINIQNDSTDVLAQVSCWKNGSLLEDKTVSLMVKKPNKKIES